MFKDSCGVFLTFGLLAAVGTPTILHAQTRPYEFTLGMSSHQIENMVDKSQYKVITDRSSKSDTQWEAADHDLFFCNNQLRAIRIKLHSSVASFSSAVENESNLRGNPTYKLQSRVFGEVKAEWRLEPYRYVTLSLHQLSNSEIFVDRWLSDIRDCEI